MMNIIRNMHGITVSDIAAIAAMLGPLLAFLFWISSLWGKEKSTPHRDLEARIESEISKTKGKKSHGHME